MFSMMIIRGLSVLLLSMLSIVTATEENLYETLGVARDASTDEIKRKARKLVLKHHPDKSDAPDAAEKFAAVTKAFEILKDEKKRATYDRYGMKGLKQEAEGHGGAGDFGDPFDIFAEFFGGSGRRQRAQDTRKAAPVNFKLRVTLEQLFFGDIIDYTYNRKVLCINSDDCFSSRSDCKAAGVKVVMRQIGPGFVVQNQVADSECVGPGRGWQANCKYCPKGISSLQETNLSIAVERGMRDGDKVVFDGLGEQDPSADPGDVNFTVETAPDPNYTRSGSDLKIILVIDLEEALVGFATQVMHINREKLTIKSDNVIHDGQVIVIPGKGMPRKGQAKGFGDLHVTCKIQYPTNLTQAGKELIKRAFKDAKYA